MPMSDYQHLMENLYQSHRDFHREWRDWQNGKLSPKAKKQLKGREPESVAARNKFFDATNLFFNAKLAPLETKFRTNPESAVDEIIEFLAIDIPAFRCGYAKEWFLKKLKTVALKTSQQQKLRQIALELLSRPNYRREIGEWSRLMITLADESFIEELENLIKNSDPARELRAKRVRDKIFHHRKDLARGAD